MKIKEMKQERIQKIKELLEQKGMVRNDELMARFGISIETVRRDLKELETQQVIEQVYGGAVLKRKPLGEPDYVIRSNSNEREKDAIARLAASRIGANETVYFDIGTTLWKVAQYLTKEQRPITAFTSALRTAITLSENPCATVILPAGRLRPGELALSGITAEQTLQQFNISQVLLGAGGITARGISDYNLDEAMLRKQIVKGARKITVLADSSKFQVEAQVNICDFSVVDTLITTSAAQEQFPEILQAIAEQGTELLIADIG